MRQTMLILVIAAGAAACQSPAAPTPMTGAPAGAAALGTHSAGPATTGGGRYLLQNALDIRFAFSAVTGGSGPAGQFHQALLLDGLAVEFRGTVTCVTADAVNRRAWVGGVITANASAHPSFQTARHQPGHDIWFRVLDSGEGASAAPDRTTFLGFEGDAGFDTSAAYCAGQPWPADNARTWPVTAGNIQVRP